MANTDLDAGTATPADGDEEGLRAQRTFTALMRAMSEPGRVEKMDALTGVPEALPSGLASVACALADFETSLWLDPHLAANEAVTRYLRFQTGAPIVADAGKASFALVSNAEELPPFDHFALGSQDYPDRSATIVMEVQSFASATRYDLTGPGIETSASFAPGPLPADFEDRMNANRALFPRGVDLILTSKGEVASLPRSTRVQRAA